MLTGKSADIAALIDGAALAITGGTGSLGQALTAEIMTHYHPAKLVIISRSESRQAAMKERFPEGQDSPLRYFIRDVRDRSGLRDAFESCQIIIHAAALKRIEVCDREPVEAIQTNIIGTVNACEAARECGAERFMFISSDKATSASVYYGGLKYVGERLTCLFNNYRGKRHIRYSACRYGNVLGSTGSIVNTFRDCNGKVPITDAKCTRFWITTQDAARFILSSLVLAKGGEVFIPRMKALGIQEMAGILAPNRGSVITGMRGVEKRHECLYSADESPWVVELEDRFILLPPDPQWSGGLWPGTQHVEDGSSFTSQNAPKLKPHELLSMIGRGEHAEFAVTR